MKELHRVIEIMREIPKSAVITDGRFSGATGGLSVGYLCPEAALGGPIALVEEGDTIGIDLERSRIWFDASERELDKRRAAHHGSYRLSEHDYERGLLARYAQLVQPARNGAVPSEAEAAREVRP